MIPRNLARAVRSLSRAPAFTVTTILLIGMGAGSVTGAVALIDHVLVRPLPYPDSRELLVVDGEPLTGPAFRQLKTTGAVRTWAAVSWGEAVRIAALSRMIKLW